MWNSYNNFFQQGDGNSQDSEDIDSSQESEQSSQDYQSSEEMESSQEEEKHIDPWKIKTKELLNCLIPDKKRFM